MVVRIRNLQKRKKINLSSLEKKVCKISKILRLSQREIHIVLSDNKLVGKLNKIFLKKNYPTDVLAFTLQDRYPRNLLGEIVISVEEATKNSKIYATSFERELMLYIIHGILHLMGYKDYRPKDREKMRKKEEELLTQIKA